MVIGRSCWTALYSRTEEPGVLTGARRSRTIWVGDAPLRDILLDRFPMLDPARISVIEGAHDPSTLAGEFAPRLPAHRSPPRPSGDLLRRLQDRLGQPPATAGRLSALAF